MNATRNFHCNAALSAVLCGALWLLPAVVRASDPDDKARFLAGKSCVMCDLR